MAVDSSSHACCAKEAQDGVEERDNLLIEVEDFKAQAHFHKERRDRLAKELAETKRENKTLSLKVESTFLVRVGD